MARTAPSTLLLAGVLFSGSARSEENPSDPPDITGTFHLRMRAETHAKVPVLGTAIINTTTDLLASVSRQGQQWVQRHTTCAVNTVTRRAIAQTILPDRFIRSLGVKRYALDLEQHQDGWSYTARLNPQHIGYDSKVSGGVMPTDKEDPSIIDWDNDGKPGATILLKIPLFGKVAIHMVQFNHTQLDGRIESADRISGHVIMLQQNQRTIGADNRLFIANPSIKPAPEPQPFEMERIPEGSTCAAVLSKAAALQP